MCSTHRASSSSRSAPAPSVTGHHQSPARVLLCFSLLSLLSVIPHANSAATGRLASTSNEDNATFKCYQSNFFPNKGGQQEPLLNRSEFCTGKVCITSTPLDSSSNTARPIRRTCLDQPADLGISPGKCDNVADERVGQTDRVCACKGDWCNGASSNSVERLVSGFSVAMYKLTLGSSLLFGLLNSIC